ncbi:MAG: Ca-activated chloride channel [Myxococcales bacterium]|nr:Ca-activated chloride channel [Myxococcales bacterium]
MSTMRRGASWFLLFGTMIATAADQPRAQADREPLADEGGDRTLAPYFFVGGGDPSVDRLPLKETSADIQIAGVVARVRVHQIFDNTGDKPIEAVYVFPASTRAAVHGMRMKIGVRVIEAHIDRKEKAHAEYEQAKADGKRAALLDQERSNVLTTRVANVMPMERIEVELDYSELLVPHDAVYELVYPGVVGPRYSRDAHPGKDEWVASAYLPSGVPEPCRFDVRVHLETGIPIKEVSSPSHAVAVTRPSPSVADVRLAQPGGGNRDYVLRYRLAGDRIETGLLLSGEVGNDKAKERFFALMMEPPARPDDADVTPREYVFLVDVSGSMNGFPLDTTKVLMRRLLGGLRDTDAFNVVLFSGAFRVMSPQGSVPASADNVRTAANLLDHERGGGGTELMGGLRAAYAVPRKSGLSRTVVVVTDGYVDVEEEAFRFIRTQLSSVNLFAFGIGSGVNRALIEGMARAGYGEPFVVLKPEEAPAAAERFRMYIDRPLLTGISVAFHGFSTYDVAPAQVPDLMARRPLVVFGKYRGDASGQIEITGRGARGFFRQVIEVNPRLVKAANAPLRVLWARTQVQWLEDQLGLRASDTLTAELGELGVRYDLLTAATSFVAVDYQVANATGSLATVAQPLPLPAGVSNHAVGVSMSRSEMPPGDPVLSLVAPGDARLVTAYFPFGLVKDLTYDAYVERWQVRFLVPKDVPDGEYRVPVVITYRDGHSEVVEAQYRIDSAEPDFDLDVVGVAGGAVVTVTAREPLRAATVALVSNPRVRVELDDQGGGLTFKGTLSLPPGRHRLRVVVADGARNEADSVVTCEVR